jgi:hypothetical protein
LWWADLRDVGVRIGHHQCTILLAVIGVLFVWGDLVTPTYGPAPLLRSNPAVGAASAAKIREMIIAAKAAPTRWLLNRSM